MYDIGRNSDAIFYASDAKFLNLVITCGISFDESKVCWVVKVVHVSISLLENPSMWM